MSSLQTITLHGHRKLLSIPKLLILGFADLLPSWTQPVEDSPPPR